MKIFPDKWTLAVIFATIVFFVAALFTQGLTHDILFEAGVLLVSVKLIMMAYRNTLNYLDVKKDLEEIKNLLRGKNQ